MLIILEREKLYAEIWTIKMKDLAKSYGISEGSLRKYCRQLHVPFPQSGYWTKVKNGINPKKIKLPEFDGENKIVVEKHEYKNKYTKDNRLKHMKEEEKNRAFRIMDKIFKSLESLGFQIKSKNRDTRVCIGKEEVKIGLKEKLIRSEHVKTDEDSYSIPVYDYKYSGELTLFIDSYDAPKKSWKDLNDSKVEEMIGDFIIAIIDTAEIIRCKNEQRQMDAEIRKQKEIDKKKLEKKQDYDMKKIEELKMCAENYILSIKIDEYISALEKEITNIKDNEKIDKIFKYIKWARERSEWLNPIKQKNDEILGKKYNDNLYDIEYEEIEWYSSSMESNNLI